MTTESERVLSDKMHELKSLPWDAVKRLLDHQLYNEVMGESGAKYGLEVTAFWDDHRAKEVVRVLVEVIGRYDRATGSWSGRLGSDELLLDEHGVRAWE